MTISPLAGKPAPKELLVDLARLERDYFARRISTTLSNGSALGRAGIAALRFVDRSPKRTF